MDVTTRSHRAPATVVARTRDQLAHALDRHRGRSRAVVMTMGALHEGHLTLVREARARADVVVVTVFVNPLQFGHGEDLDSYPRDLEGDLALLRGLDGPDGPGADVVFAPSAAEVYPGGEPLVTVDAGPVGRVLEGAHRPGHFDGVLTVVLKLLGMVRPDVALFGEKDAQQLVAIRRMVTDLEVGVEVVGVPTVRDADGLAMSSRNTYLDREQRTTALALSQALGAARMAAQAGSDVTRVHRAAVDRLSQEAGLVVDYVALVDPVTLAELPDGYGGTA
ncbi:pantothenate synthetase, partial [Cellulomonas bogoriensis 69B4 = DSM 16987]